MDEKEALKETLLKLTNQISYYLSKTEQKPQNLAEYWKLVSSAWKVLEDLENNKKMLDNQ